MSASGAATKIVMKYSRMSSCVERFEASCGSGSVLKDDPPSQQEVTRVVQEMSKIAREKIEGEPVVDYDTELETLHISDPFFAYFLRWGTTAD